MKAFILLGRGYEDVEAIYPFYRLKAAGIDTEMVSPTGGTITGKNSIAFESVPISEVNPDDADVLVIPGGWAPDRLRIIPSVVDFVRRAAANGAVIGAVCHGPQLLIEADLVSGRKMTGWPSVATDLTNAGAIFEDAAVVVDGQFITSRKPDDLPQFGEALVEQAIQTRKRPAATQRAASPVKGK
jgi:protease I